MKPASLILVTCASLTAPAVAAAAPKPPMGQFDGAYYTCDKGAAFEIDYDSASPKSATLTTSNNNAQYKLKRIAGASGVEFSNGTVSLQVSGQQATVRGTAVKLTDCMLKNTT